MVSSGTVRGTFITMLERFDLHDVRGFWRSLPMMLEGRELDEAGLYQYLWEGKGAIHLYYIDEVNRALNDFLFDRKLSHEKFYDEDHFRFKQGGMWSTRESLEWIEKILPDLYEASDPKEVLLDGVCEWARSAAKGAASEIHWKRKNHGSVSGIFSFAPDGTFRSRCPFLFSRSTIIGMRLFPKFLGLSPFEETRLLADCLHPNDILKTARGEVTGKKFFINGRPHGKVLPFWKWARPLNLKFTGEPVPNRDVILAESSYRCPVRGIDVLVEGCVYDAPVFLARISYRRAHPGIKTIKPGYLANILHSMSLKDTPEWSHLEGKYRQLLDLAKSRLVFEYRDPSQLMLLNGRSLIAGVPAMILRKLLSQWSKGQEQFDFRAFKHDPQIFADSKRSSFETRWNRLREKLHAKAPNIKVERSGKGKFTLKVDCPVELREAE